MGKICKKCGYERQIEDIAAYYECPKCGVCYARSEKKIESQTIQQRKWAYAQLLGQQSESKKSSKNLSNNSFTKTIVKYFFILIIYLFFIFLVFKGGGWSLLGCFGLISFLAIGFASWLYPSNK